MFWITYTVTGVVLTNNHHWLIPTQCHKGWQRNRTSRNSTSAHYNFHRQLKWTTWTRITVSWHGSCSVESKLRRTCREPAWSAIPNEWFNVLPGVFTVFMREKLKAAASPRRRGKFYLSFRVHFSLSISGFRSMSSRRDSKLWGMRRKNIRSVSSARFGPVLACELLEMFLL